MRAHAANAGVQEKACCALINITFSDDARRQVAADTGALPQIVAAMSAHAGKAAVLQGACWALGHITTGVNAQDKARKKAAANAGVLPQIVVDDERTRGQRRRAAAGVLGAGHYHIRRRCAGHYHIRRRCTGLRFTFGDDAQGYACKQAAADAGALPQIVVAMHTRAVNAIVQQWACQALVHITANNDEQGCARAQAAADAVALPQIVAAMRTLAANAGVQQWACRALANITAGDSA